MITMYWVYDLPNWLFALLCISAFVTFGLAGLPLTRRMVKHIHQEDHSHNDIVGYYLAAVTVFYGITLGLVAVGTWNNYSAVEEKVGHEAQALTAVYRDISVFGDPDRSVMQMDLKQYAREVVDNSWPEMRAGVVPTGSAKYLTQFQAHLSTLSPADYGGTVRYAEAYKQFNELVEARRARLDAVTTGLPRSLWWMVILGALTCIAATYFFDMRSDVMHRWMTALMSGLLGLMIFLVATLDNPFRGHVSISPAAIERVYETVMVQGN
jgi:hypothetical protein